MQLILPHIFLPSTPSALHGQNIPNKKAKNISHYHLYMHYFLKHTNICLTYIAQPQCQLGQPSHLIQNGYDTNVKSEFHVEVVGHSIDDCIGFKSHFKYMIENGWITVKEINNLNHILLPNRINIGESSTSMTKFKKSQQVLTTSCLLESSKWESLMQMPNKDNFKIKKEPNYRTSCDVTFHFRKTCQHSLSSHTKIKFLVTWVLGSFFVVFTKNLVVKPS